jgi:transmembrane sensor
VILRQASRWYDVDVTYKKGVPAREFTGRISRNVKASELLNMLNMQVSTSILKEKT